MGQIRVDLKLLPAGYEDLPAVRQLEMVLGGTLVGAMAIAQCDPLKLLPQQLVVWNDLRRHTWNIMMSERHRAEDKEALAALSERFGNVQQGAMPKRGQDG